MTNTKSKIKKGFALFFLIIGLIFIMLFSLFIIFYNKTKLDTAKLTSVNNGVVIYSSKGENNSINNTNRSLVDIDELPEHVTKAFIDAEDKRFYSHNGYDVKRIVKASFVNLTSNSKSQGASTISQQLIKNALLSNEKTFKRKAKEIVLAMKLEKKFTKKEILEMYLNTIYFGSNAYGIENASKIYFNKNAKDLSLNEACCLAGIIKSPAKYSPINNYQNCVKRKNDIAKLMYDNDDINKQQYQEIVSEPITLADKNSYENSYERESIYEACKLLNITERELINNNYEIITFKDDDLQNKVIDNHNAILSNKENIDSVTIIANNEGKVLSYYANSYYNLHNMKRQPASLLKPLAVYLPCIEHNILTPASTILDEEINYNGFKPRNADNKFHGNVSTRYALAESLNIPAVKALDYVGVDKAYDSLEKLGINISKDDKNLSLALGSVKNGVSLIDLLTAYSILANEGHFRGVNFVDKILDKNKNIVYSYENFSQKIVDENDCYLINDMLKDTSTYGTAKRFNSLNLPIASKTGTAYNGTDNTDLYNVAYTTEHTCLTWIANLKDNKLPNEMYSSVEPTEINKQIFSELYKNNTPKDFVKPKNVEKLPYDVLELKNNNRIIEPKSNLDRYIAYDYFKVDNKPKSLQEKENIKFDITLDKFGAKIKFTGDSYTNYNLYKTIDNKKILVGNVNKNFVNNEFIDNEIFKYNKIEYSVYDQNNIVAIKTIYPKDYLINKLNTELLTTKKKWYV